IQYASLPGMRHIIDSAQSEAVFHIASRPFFRRQVIVILRNCGLKHRGTEVRRITQVLRPGIVSQESPTANITTANVHIAGVVPALRRVLQEVDGTDRETDGAVGASCRGRNIRDIGRQLCPFNETDAWERTAWPNGSRPRRRVVNQVSTLKVQT